MLLSELPSATCTVWIKVRHKWRVADADRVLREVGISETEHDGFLFQDGMFGPEYFIKLSEQDGRLHILKDRLEEQDFDTRYMWARHFTATHRRKAPWLSSRGSTTSVLVNLDTQKWNREGACKECGAGVVPEHPLKLKAAQVPKGGLGISARIGMVVASEHLADQLVAANLTGFEVFDAERPRGSQSKECWKWLRIDSTWPRMQGASGWHLDRWCDACGRTGYYPELHQDSFYRLYKAPPEVSPDFAYSWEQWGTSIDDPEHCGGAPDLIVSQRAYQMLRKNGVRIGFDPVIFEQLGQS